MYDEIKKATCSFFGYQLYHKRNLLSWKCVSMEKSKNKQKQSRFAVLENGKQKGCVRLPKLTELPEWTTGMDFYM